MRTGENAYHSDWTWKELIVDPRVAGSNPVTHPILVGAGQPLADGKATVAAGKRWTYR
jgi:hypothetical protein